MTATLHDRIAARRREEERKAFAVAWAAQDKRAVQARQDAPASAPQTVPIDPIPWAKPPATWESWQKPAAPGFGAMLRDYRTRRGISQSELGRRIDVTHSYVSRFETGQRQPTYHVVTAIANVLRIDGVDRSKLFAAAGFGADDDMPMSCAPPIVRSLSAALTRLVGRDRSLVVGSVELILKGVDASSGARIAQDAQRRDVP